MDTHRANIDEVTIIAAFNFASREGYKRVRLSLAPPVSKPYKPYLSLLLALRNKARDLLFTPFVTARKWSKWIVSLFITNLIILLYKRMS